MMIERLTPPGVPAPRGPYSPAVRAGGFIFVAGQGPVDVTTDKMSYGDIQHETRLVLSNIKRILEGCGATMADVVKCSVFLSDGKDFGAMNAGLRRVLRRRQTGPNHRRSQIRRPEDEGRNRLHRVQAPIAPNSNSLAPRNALCHHSWGVAVCSLACL